jgi:hypothetical protein
MSALECCRRQAGSDRSPAAWICIRPTWSPSSTLLSRPPPGPRRGRRRPGPASRRPHRADRARPRPGPLTAGQLTHAPGMAAAAHHSRQCRRPGQPGPGGPLALRRIPPGTWTVTPRLDILTQAQRRALRHLTGAAILDDDLPASACRAKRHLRRSAGTARLGRRRNRTPGNRPVLRHQRPGRSPRRRRRQKSASATATTATSPASSASPPPLDQPTTYPARGAEARPGTRE